MTEIQDIIESIRYSCRHNPMYGEDLINKVKEAFQVQKYVKEMVEYLKSEIERSDVASYKSLCYQELNIFEKILENAMKPESEQVK